MADDLAGQTQASDLRSGIQGFANNLSALREFVEVVDEVLSTRAHDELERSRADLLPLELALTIMQEDSTDSDDERARLEEQRRELERTLDGRFNVTLEPTEDGPKKLTLRAKGGPHAERFGEALDRIRSARHHSALLYRNSLVALVSAAEAFLAELMHWHFALHPDAAAIQDRRLSLRELQSMGTVEDARQYLIDIRVEELMRGSFEQWIDVFKTELKLSMGYLEQRHPRILEACQRRNLLVHNDGRINHIYRSKVDEVLHPKTDADGRVPVTREYVESAIDDFETSFTLIAAETWKRHAPDDAERSAALNVLAYEHLLAERWSIAESFSYFVVGDKLMPERDRIIAQVNYWQCKKWLGVFSDVETDVQTADFSAKEEIYRLAQLALLGDAERFFALLPRVLDSDALTEGDLAEWPLFREMRREDAYGQQLKKAKNARQAARRSRSKRPTQRKPKLQEHPRKSSLGQPAQRKRAKSTEDGKAASQRKAALRKGSSRSTKSRTGTRANPAPSRSRPKSPNGR